MPSCTEIESLIELLTSVDFDPNKWLTMQAEQEHLKALPASLVVEEWKCADGTVIPLESWSVNTSNQATTCILNALNGHLAYQCCSMY